MAGMGVWQAACGGNLQLTRARLKAFIRSLHLGLHASIIEQLCNDVDNNSSSTASSQQAHYIPFVDFLRLFRLDASSHPHSAALSWASKASLSSGTVSLQELEQALRERIRSCYGTLKTAFVTIDKVIAWCAAADVERIHSSHRRHLISSACCDTRSSNQLMRQPAEISLVVALRLCRCTLW